MQKNKRMLGITSTYLVNLSSQECLSSEINVLRTFIFNILFY